jgi:hypothetical protein
MLTRLIVLVLLSTPVMAQTPPDAHGLLVWDLHRMAGDDTLAALRTTDEGLAFLEAIESNDAWMHELLDSGPVQRGHIVLPFLFERWYSDPSLVQSDVHRSMAVACALAMGMKDLDAQWMADRCDWFRESWDAGLLNAGYGDLNTFERRFLARGLQRASWTTAKALEHLRERVRIPRQQYAKAAWRAPYRGHNAFGDTVQGPMYYMPFKNSYDSSAEMAIEVGGVCGSLSHVGAAAAIAAGIPALTMGEPGHCAYAVQTKPHIWQPAYSLSWKRGLHTTMTRSTWTSLEMSQQAMTDADKVNKASTARRRALWLEANDSVPKADAAWRRACNANPLDESMWKDRAAFGQRHALSGVWWNNLRDDLQSALLPSHPEPAWYLLQAHVYPGLLETAKGQRKRAAVREYLGQVDGWGDSVRWRIEAAFEWAWKRTNTKARKSALLEDMLVALIDDSKLGPPYVVWAQAKVADKADLKATFETALLEQAGGEGDGPKSVLTHMAKTMLPAAAEEHDLDTFQRIGKASSSLYAPRKTLADMKVEPFAGELLSSGGAIRIFKPGNRWDSPEKHWGVLEEHGGWFHTQNGETPWFEIELPRFGNLSGIILDSRSGQPGRANGVRILVSDDGEQWTQVGKTTSGSPMQRIDLGQTKPRARFVRFERDGQCMHYHRVLIYGERAS